MDRRTFPLMPSRGSAWRQVTFALVGITLLGLSLMPGGVSANQQGSPVNDAQWQIAICKAGGGKGTEIDVSPYGDNVVGSTATKCVGGYFDGVTCWNSSFYGIECWGRKIVAGPTVPMDLPLLTYAEGSQLGIDATVLALSQVVQPAQAPTADQGADARPANHEKKHAKAKGNHRGQGKGKNGGKRHR